MEVTISEKFLIIDGLITKKAQLKIDIDDERRSDRFKENCREELAKIETLLEKINKEW